MKLFIQIKCIPGSPTGIAVILLKGCVSVTHVPAVTAAWCCLVLINLVFPTLCYWHWIQALKLPYEFPACFKRHYKMFLIRYCYLYLNVCALNFFCTKICEPGQSNSHNHIHTPLDTVGPVFTQHDLQLHNQLVTCVGWICYRVKLLKICTFMPRRVYMCVCVPLITA